MTDVKQNNVRALWTLTIMQLKEKMDVAYLRSFKKTLFHVIFAILEFVAITAICYLLFWAAKFFNVFDLAGLIPTNVLVVVFTVMLTLSIVFATAGLVNSLYLSRDNLVLLTLPATPTMVFLSKLLVYYVYEFKKNFMFLIPFFCAYGISCGMPVYYYPWVLVLFIFIAAIPVLLSALLSIPALYVYQFLRKFRVLQYVLFTAVFFGLLFAAYYAISMIPENINIVETWGTTFFKIKHFLTTFERIALPVTWLTALVVGKPQGIVNHLFGTWTLPILAGLLATLALCVTLGLVISKPLFYKMASKPFEYTKKTRIKEHGNKKTSPLFSAIKKEWLVASRNNTLVSLVGQLVVIMPLAIALLNSLYQAMNTRFVGLQMTVCFNLIIVLLFMLSANVRLSSVYSKDGFSAYLNKVQPSTYGSLLFSKLTVNLVVGFFGVILTTIVYAQYGALNVRQLFLFATTVYFVFVAHAFWSAEMDIMNPQTSQYATFSEQSNNPNENKSTGLAFGMAFVWGVGQLLLAMENSNIVWWKLFGVALVLLAFRIWAFFIKIKVYYKEK
jgi:hypothetical protein